MRLHLSIGEAVKFGWHTVWSNIGFFILFSFIYFIIELGFPLIIQAIVGSPAGVQTPDALYTSSTPPLSGTSIFIIAILSLLNLVITFLATIYFTRITLLFVDGKKPSIREIFSYPVVPAPLRLIGGTILFYLLIVGLLIPLFLASIVLAANSKAGLTIAAILVFIWTIPAIYLALRYSLFSYPIIDRGEGIIKAFKLSARMTHTTKLRLLALIILLALINILGALALLVGLLVTLPMSMLAMAYTYRTLRSQVENASSAQPDPAATPVVQPAPTPTASQ